MPIEKWFKIDWEKSETSLWRFWYKNIREISMVWGGFIDKENYVFSTWPIGDMGKLSSCTTVHKSEILLLREGVPGALSVGSYDWHTKSGQGDIHVWCQGQKPREDPMPEGQWQRSYSSEVKDAAEIARLPWRRNTAKRSYPHPRPGVAARRSNHTSKEQWLCGSRRA